MTIEAWSVVTGLPPGVLAAQADRGLWPVVHVGKRVLINVEAVRAAAALAPSYFTLGQQ
jgi:hypothetical protein